MWVNMLWNYWSSITANIKALFPPLIKIAKIYTMSHLHARIKNRVMLGVFGCIGSLMSICLTHVLLMELGTSLRQPKNWNKQTRKQHTKKNRKKSQFCLMDIIWHLQVYIWVTSKTISLGVQIWQMTKTLLLISRWIIIPSWISHHMSSKSVNYGIKLLTYSLTSAAAPLKFIMGLIIGFNLSATILRSSFVEYLTSYTPWMHLWYHHRCWICQISRSQ